MKKNLAVLVLSSLTLLVACNNGGTSSTSQSSSSSLESSTVESSVSESSSEEKVCIEDNKVHLIILTGQSGARGKAVNSDLTDEQKEENLDVDICADGLDMPRLNKIPETLSAQAVLKALKPGFGDNSSEFGPELGMGETLASRFPRNGESRKSVIVKYTACGSTFLNHWYSESAIDDVEICDKLDLEQIRSYEATDKETGEVVEKSTGPLTNNLYQLIDSTIAQLADEGFETVIDGAIFVHGEQDAKFDDNMDIFEKSMEYFIKDLRNYVGNEEMPFIVTEALTNSAKYSNRLREIQRGITEKVDHTSFVSTTDLYTNTFEPWHFGTESNFILGNRAAAELISYNDNRKVVSFEEKEINVPLNAEVALPKYLKATFDNEYEGYVKIDYTSEYDRTKLGIQEVSFKAETNCGTYNGTLKVNVTTEPFVDGVLNEYATTKKNTSEGIGDIYVTKGENGLYVSAKINDKDLWTDGESWHTGDMGQKDANDDFRIYIATDDADARYTACLSAANLLRMYADGTTLTDAGLPKKNLVYTKMLGEYKYHVTTHGIVNVEDGEASNGMDLELYLPYEDIGVDDPDTIKLCFNYNNVTSTSGKKTNEDHYFAKNAVANAETDINNYFSISELI